MLKGLLAISGQPGLFKMVAESKNKIIVESLITGKRMPANSTAKISSLEDIAIYTATQDVPLKEIFKKILTHENGGPAIDAKAPEKELKIYFETVVPDYDKTRVYISDIKKVILWYNLLQEKALLNFEEEVVVEEEAEEQPTIEDSTEKTSE